MSTSVSADKVSSQCPFPSPPAQPYSFKGGDGRYAECIYPELMVRYYGVCAQIVHNLSHGGVYLQAADSGASGRLDGDKVLALEDARGYISERCSRGAFHVRTDTSVHAACIETDGTDVRLRHGEERSGVSVEGGVSDGAALVACSDGQQLDAGDVYAHALGNDGSVASVEGSGTREKRETDAVDNRGGDTKGVVGGAVRGPNYERNRLNREKKKAAERQRKNGFFSVVEPSVMKELADSRAKLYIANNKKQLEMLEESESDDGKVFEKINKIARIDNACGKLKNNTYASSWARNYAQRKTRELVGDEFDSDTSSSYDSAGSCFSHKRGLTVDVMPFGFIERFIIKNGRSTKENLQKRRFVKRKPMTIDDIYDSGDEYFTMDADFRLELKTKYDKLIAQSIYSSLNIDV